MVILEIIGKNDRELFKQCNYKSMQIQHFNQIVTVFWALSFEGKSTKLINGGTLILLKELWDWKICSKT